MAAATASKRGEATEPTAVPMEHLESPDRAVAQDSKTIRVISPLKLFEIRIQTSDAVDTIWAHVVSINYEPTQVSEPEHIARTIA